MRIFAETAASTPNPILPLWQEIVVGLIAFGVVFFVLWKYVFPRMEETFKARVDAIEGGIKRADERQAEAQALFEQYQLQLAEAPPLPEWFRRRPTRVPTATGRRTPKKDAAYRWRFVSMAGRANH